MAEFLTWSAEKVLGWLQVDYKTWTMRNIKPESKVALEDSIHQQDVDPTTAGLDLRSWVQNLVERNIKLNPKRRT